MGEFIITFDVDWACDPVINAVSNFMGQTKSTWFITHNSEGTQNLIKNLNIEVGLHPNFLFGTTQGNNHIEVVESLLKIYESAKSIRTHAMVYSAYIARLFADYNLQIDSSVYLGQTRNILPYKTKYRDYKEIIRVPYSWADDGELENPEWEIPPNNSFKVFNFHPIHVYLNCTCLADYLRFKEEVKNPQYDKEVIKYRNKISNEQYKEGVFGVRDYLLSILETQKYFKTLAGAIEEMHIR